MCRYCADLTPAARSRLHGNGKGSRNALIRAEAAKGVPHAKLAATFNLSRQRISVIVGQRAGGSTEQGMPPAQPKGV